MTAAVAEDQVTDQTIDQEWLARLCRRGDEILWGAYRFALAEPGAAWPRLLFPLKGREHRIGEQDARVALIAALLTDPDGGAWALSVEAPTRLSYRPGGRAAGPRAQRAVTDLALYRGGDGPDLAVAFTSGGRSGKAEHDDGIRREMAQVLAEQPAALWFHIVRDAGGPAVAGLLRALEAAVSLLSNPYKLAAYVAAGKTPEPRAKPIAFHLCLMETGLTASLHRVLDYVPGRPDDDFFSLDAGAGPLTLAAAVELAERRGWSVHRQAG